VEFQVLADTNGNAVHLCERECSLQRRHQKIVEETPSAALDRELRQRMGEAAVSVVKTTGYTNAGTVEFLLDDDGNFYFLEVNTRIQVEHPITEMVTGVDLVQWQIRIAAGEPLTLRQEDIEQRGHAIECRIYAEDASNQFLPSLGRILYQKEPQGPGIRVDSGIYSGWEVTRHYDPILSKLIAWGQNREISRQRMINALREYVILGVTTTIPFLIDVIDHPAFIEARTDTGFIPTYFPNWKPNNNQDDMASVLIAAALYQSQKTNTPSPSLGDRDMYSPWQNLGEWSQ
jgi:acetyl/propionyl-CoA carboxylase alpha subunit